MFDYFDKTMLRLSATNISSVSSVPIASFVTVIGVSFVKTSSLTLMFLLTMKLLKK